MGSTGRIEGNTPVSSSNVPSKTGGAIPRPLTVEEIYAIADKYAEAAKRAQMAGFNTVDAGGTLLLIMPIFITFI